MSHVNISSTSLCLWFMQRLPLMRPKTAEPLLYELQQTLRPDEFGSEDPQPHRNNSYRRAGEDDHGDTYAKDYKTSSGNNYPLSLAQRRGYHPPLAIPSSLAIRSSIGGCVEKSFRREPPERGFTMNMWADAGLASCIGIMCEAV